MNRGANGSSRQRQRRSSFVLENAEWNSALVDNHTPFRRYLLRIACAILLAASVSCRKEPKPAERLNVTKPLLPGEIALKPWVPESPLQVANVVHKPASIEFTITEGDSAGQSANLDPLLFCIPPEKMTRVKVLGYGLAEPDPTPAATPNADEPPPPDEKELAAKAGQFAEIKPFGIMRRWNLAILTLKSGFFSSPLAAPGGKPARIQARLAIEWDGDVPVESHPPVPGELEPNAPWRQTLAKLVSNPDALSLYEIATPPLRKEIKPAASYLPAAVNRGGHWARLRLVKEGLYRLAVENLAGAGFRADELDPARIRLFYRGKPHPLLRQGTGRDQKIYFWNDANDSQYTEERVYWVTSAPSEPDAIVQAANPAPEGNTRTLNTTLRTAAIERDNDLILTKGKFLMILDMNWLDAPLTAEKPIQLPLTFFDAALTSDALTVRAELYIDLPSDAITSYDTKGLQAVLTHENDTVATAPIQAANRQNVSFPLSPSLIKDGAVNLAVSARRQAPARPTSTSSVDKLWLDRVSMRYPSHSSLEKGRLTLESADAPTTVTLNWSPLAGKIDGADLVSLFTRSGEAGASTSVSELKISEREGKPGILWPNEKNARVEIYEPSVIPAADKFEAVSYDDLTSEQNGADYLIIAHHDFIAGVQPLAEMHTKEGLKVRVTDVQSVFDTFNGGESSPEAIRDFLSYTLGHWKMGAPSRVLLVGDCTSDYRGYARNGIVNWVPSYEREGGGHRWATDEWMTLVAGDDLLPDFIIGRLSVNSPADLAAIVNKEIKYAQGEGFGPWRSRAGYVADDDAVFSTSLDDLRLRDVPPAMDARRIYLSEASLEDNWYATDGAREERYAREKWWWKVSADATGRIANMLRSGAGLVTYFGHGSPNVWAEERMWFGGESENSDNLLLRDSGYESFIINLTCNSGAIDYPVPRWNVNIIEDMMRTKNGGAIATFVPSGPGFPQRHEEVAREMYQLLFRDRVRDLGELVALTKARYAAKGNPEDFIYMYLLLGDPALKLQITDDLRTFDLAQSVISPGGRIDATLAQLTPASGQYAVSVEQPEKGDTLWSGKTYSYTGGKIPLAVALPPDLPLGPKTLRVAAWNETEKKDFAASARFDIRNPEDAIASSGVQLIDEKKARLRIDIAAAATIPSQGSKAELFVLDGETTKSLETRPYEIEAGKSVTLEFDVSRPPAERAAAYELRLHAPGPAYATDAPRFPSVRWAVPGASLKPRLVRELSNRTVAEKASMMTVSAVALLPREADPTQLMFVLATADGKTVTTSTLEVESHEDFILAEGVLRTTSDLPAGLQDGSLSLGDGAARIDTLPLSQVRQSGPRLRLVPGSVRSLPADASEGETIWIHARVENTGDLPSPTAWCRLLDNAPTNGGKPVYNHLHLDSFPIPALGPWRSAEVTLRWDPVKNAGDQRYWVQLDPPPGSLGALPGSLLTDGGLHVRSKAKLRQEGFLVRANQEDRKAGRLHLLVDIINDGETDAPSVVVAFYNSATPDQAKRIYETTLDVVPAHGKKSIHYAWNVRAAGNSVATKDGKVLVSLQYYRKGSQQLNKVEAIQAEP